MSHSSKSGTSASTSASAAESNEKNLKIIKELGKLEDNKFCFDCHQRGPIFVNMTIGSFVCTKCSGFLRNFNHRVKGINMSNFSDAELELLKRRGNKACSLIYFANCPANFVLDEQSLAASNIERHLQQKYVAKKWYSAVTAQIEQDAISNNKVAFRIALGLTPSGGGGAAASSSSGGSSSSVHKGGGGDPSSERRRISINASSSGGMVVTATAPTNHQHHNHQKQQQQQQQLRALQTHTQAQSTQRPRAAEPPATQNPFAGATSAASSASATPSLFDDDFVPPTAPPLFNAQQQHHQAQFGAPSASSVSSAFSSSANNNQLRLAAKPALLPEPINPHQSTDPFATSPANQNSAGGGGGMRGGGTQSLNSSANDKYAALAQLDGIRSAAAVGSVPTNQHAVSAAAAHSGGISGGAASLAADQFFQQLNQSQPAHQSYQHGMNSAFSGAASSTNPFAAPPTNHFAHHQQQQYQQQQQQQQQQQSSFFIAQQQQAAHPRSNTNPFSMQTGTSQPQQQPSSSSMFSGGLNAASNNTNPFL